MGLSPNRYLNEPRLYELSTRVVGYEALQLGGWAIAGAETIFRPEGGGQPQDHGSVEIHGVRHEVTGLHKADGKVFIHLSSLLEEPTSGIPIEMAIDSNRRDCLSKLHTLQHIFSAATHQIIPNAEIPETGILEDASGGWIDLKLDNPTSELLFQIDRKVRSVVLSNLPVRNQKLKSLEQCEWEFGSLFRFDSKAKLSGKVRVVVIEDFDANCCSGTHWLSSNVGPYEMRIAPDGDISSIVRLEFYLSGAWMYWYPDVGPALQLDHPQVLTVDCPM